jgi:glycerol kinase
MAGYLLALDQGTTSSRAILFDSSGAIVSVGQREFPQILPHPGHVEHDPEDIWQSQLASALEAIEKAGIGSDAIDAIGIANQRETTVLWEKDGGAACGNAIVWQSRISAPVCERLKADGNEETFRAKTGLRLDPYFSGTKLTHRFEQDPALRQRAERGEILFGTVDSYLTWRLTGGRKHVTDVSNASRTLMYDLHKRQWDDELISLLGVPPAVLPEVVASSGIVGYTDPKWFGREIPIAGIAGDQQAATFGQTCFSPGMAKNTYGTGCFLVWNTGSKPQLSNEGLLTTILWQLGDEVTYGLEGSIFVGGAAVQWLRDGLGIIENSADVESLAAQVPDNGGVVVVPAFVGMGAPYWDPYARGGILGLTRGSTAAHIARATVESMAFQTRDVLDCMQREAGFELSELRVDGGASINNELMQFQADVLGVTVTRPKIAETTALGAAFLAGLAVGTWGSLDELATQWQVDRRFESHSDAVVEGLYQKWQLAVQRCLAWETPLEQARE